MDDEKHDEDDDDECMYLGAKVEAGVGQSGAIPRLAGLRTSLICWFPNLLGSGQLP